MLKAFLCSFLLLNCVLLGYSLSSYEETLQTTTEEANETLPQDLYVIKTIVYEVGILTDADNDTDDNSTEISHQIDLTFYDPQFNGSEIDLSNIPLPIQTNVSGYQVTGLAPVNLGNLSVPPPGHSVNESAANLPLGVPIIPNAIVTVSHNVSTTDSKKGEQVLSTLPAILGLGPYIGTTSAPSTNSSSNENSAVA